jgi:hypothetical protein
MYSAQETRENSKRLESLSFHGASGPVFFMIADLQKLIIALVGSIKM